MNQYNRAKAILNIDSKESSTTGLADEIEQCVKRYYSVYGFEMHQNKTGNSIEIYINFCTKKTKK